MHAVGLALSRVRSQVGVALWRASSQVMWQVGSRGHVRSKGGWSCEVHGGHCCMGENVWN